MSATHDDVPKPDPEGDFTEQDLLELLQKEDLTPFRLRAIAKCRDRMKCGAAKPEDLGPPCADKRNTDVTWGCS
jgi:hypothetical protein